MASELSHQVYSIVLGLLFSFLEKYVQGPTRSCWRDVCGPYFWHLQCLWNCRLWLAVFIVFRWQIWRWNFSETSKISICFSLLGLIWLCHTAKLSKSALSNFKKWPNTNHICNVILCAIWHLYNLKRREKHPWRSITYISKTPPWVFSRFLNY